jgi:hypothetical protein
MWYIGWITSNELYTFLNFVQNWFIFIYDSRPLYHLRSNLNPTKLNQSEMSFYEKSNKRKTDAMFFSEVCNDFTRITWRTVHDNDVWETG